MPPLSLGSSCWTQAPRWRSTTSATRAASCLRSGPDPASIRRPTAMAIASSSSITFGVEDADASVARAKELGAEVVVEPFDAPWVRAAVLRDPDGAALNVSQFVPPEPS
ncbi:MAG: hypothetical protein H0U20_10010 [Thermoleophilaceae bacterium]|nr:hypothetical protein [Thermoleophilaceae bacterium]